MWSMIITNSISLEGSNCCHCRIESIPHLSKMNLYWFMIEYGICIWTDWIMWLVIITIAHTHTCSLSVSVCLYLLAVSHAIILIQWLCSKALEITHTDAHSVNLIHSVESTNWIINEVQALTFPMGMVEVTWIILIHCGLNWGTNHQVVSLQHATVRSTSYRNGAHSLSFLCVCMQRMENQNYLQLKPK